MELSSILPYAQVALSFLLIVVILLQQTGAGVGGAFGGADSMSGFHTRRGAEKALFYATIVIAIFFALSAFAVLVL
ncbi:MAG: preprotein translocase subunit SecG [Patescibacteria group bacterium]